MELKSFKRVCLDIEANGLLQDIVSFKNLPLKLNPHAKLWLIVLTNIDNPLETVILELNECTKENLQFCLQNTEEILTHNGVGYDLMALQVFNILEYKIYYYLDHNGNNGEIFGKPCKITDSLVWSRLLNPDRFGGHSLEVWGERTGTLKTDYRQVCIDQGFIDPKSPKGSEFQEYYEPMLTYCVDDTIATIATYKALIEELGTFDLSVPYQMELKLVDLTLKQEFYGFDFDKNLALKNLDFLNNILEKKRNSVNPLLPPKKLNKGESAPYCPPKNLFKKNGDISSHFSKFIEKIGAVLDKDNSNLIFEGRTYPVNLLNSEVCLKETVSADIEDLDHLKSFLMSQGWNPSEWKIRDLTKPSGKKIRLSDDKIKETIDRYIKDTLTGIFKQERLNLLDVSEEQLSDFLYSKSKEFSLIVPVSPCIKVGTSKTLCPNLENLGESAAFVKDVIEYLTYRHRRNSIAGGDPDPETGEHPTGYLSMVQENGRIRTPAITIGTNTFRYRHVNICNIPRVGSLFGYEMRSMFKAGKDRYEFGIDWSGLEGRVMGYYCFKYPGGPQLIESLEATGDKDLHCLSSDTLLLSCEGWVGIDQINEDTLIAQWDKLTGQISFVKPETIVKRKVYENENMVHIHGDRLDIKVTDNHRMVIYNTDTHQYIDILAGKLKDYCLENPNCYIPASGYNVVEDSLEFLIDYYINEVPNYFDDIIEKDSGYVVYSKDLSFIEEVQEELLLNNCISIIHTKYRGDTPVYQTLIPKKAGNLKGHFLRHSQIDVIPSVKNEMVWCVSIPTTYIVSKRNNKTAIVGNCTNAKNMGITRPEAKTFFYACLPIDNTEVLTPSGWKYYNQLNENDSILSYNTEKDVIELDTISKLHYFEDKEVIKSYNLRDSFESTSDHRWYGDVRTVALDRSKKKVNKFFTTSDITKEHRILMSAPYLKNDSNMSIEEARILGWILSDGFYKWSIKNQYKNKPLGFNINIVQSVQKYHNEIEEDIIKLGWEYSKYLSEKPNGNHMYQFHFQPHIPRLFFQRLGIEGIPKHEVNWIKIVLNMSSKCRDNFLETFYLGDGYGNNVITQKKGNIFEAVSLAYYLQGNRISINQKGIIDCYDIIKHRTRYLTGQKLKQESVGIRPTFCLTSNNSTFIIRQNKKFISITGNCLYGSGVPKLSKTLGVSLKEGKIIYDKFWKGMPAMLSLKEAVEKFYEKTNNSYILAIDGRKLIARSKHSLLNLLFQSAGSILVKYTIVDVCKRLEELNLLGDPFRDSLEDNNKIYLMITYHK